MRKSAPPSAEPVFGLKHDRGDRPRPLLSKRLILLALAFTFSLCSVGLMEDFQQNVWLKTYLLLAALFWGNLLIYLSLYPHWVQRLITPDEPTTVNSKKSNPKKSPKP